MNSEYVRQELLQMADLLDKKNNGYGNAYASSCEKFNDYEISKIYEKYKRIEHITCVLGQRKGKDLKDALRGEIGYCTLMLERIHADEERDKENAKSKKNLLKRGIEGMVNFYNSHLRVDDKEESAGSRERYIEDEEYDVND